MGKEYVRKIIARSESEFDLEHSDLIRASIANKCITDPTWTSILDEAYKQAYRFYAAKHLDHKMILEKLHEKSGYDVKPGECSGGSYRYYSPIKASIQSRNANKSMVIVCRLAIATGNGFEIKLRHPAGVQRYPGQLVVYWWDDTADDKQLDEFFGKISAELGH